ncbi:hypothetical protein IP92_00559 [Pseudoduganella flava]|uniref:DUF5610 domain-containing protein n=1 Tax=Pseudoduganella flava TaxID=871742 RepID=A0A562Q4B3_9BURK|nr:DUF5610 domain-containing protein [Pseudoduganella flava]QGZ41588.1 hypothetical protein GO485_22725 [Pseudoduganella flava]TWI51572.1 hypothetical protein IP92_00559 [Pseudoduganella flava]
MANSVSLNSKTISTDSRVANQGEVPSAARAKLQLNVSIMEASATISIGAQGNPQALLYRSAITGINEALKAELGENAVQNAAKQDNSPEATANRIVSLATGFFGAFKRQNPDMEDDAALQKFMDTIKGGVEQGFKEARDILQGLNALGSDVAANIEKTYGFVMKGLDDFATQAAKPKEEAEQTA